MPVPKHLYLTPLLAISLLIPAGCAHKTPPAGGTPVRMEYAKLLTIERHNDYTLATVRDPWKDNAVLHRYALVAHGGETPADIAEGTTVVRVPLRKMCVSTSVHTALMYQLGALRQVAGISEGKYILNPAVQQQIAGGHIKDVGSGLNPSVEMIAQLRTDALLMSPFEGASYGLLEKTGIPIIECADYMEATALGRAEWMKFYGMLVGREAEADSLFETIKKHYLALQKLASRQTHHPKLLADTPNGNTWYMPGGGSIYGTLYKDAGADYSLADPNASGSQPLSIEKVLTGARDADVWIIKYSRPQDHTYATLLSENNVFRQFAPYTHRRIYGCNAMKVPFYEEAPFRPDLLLKDIISILYPDLLPDYLRQFYEPLAD